MQYAPVFALFLGAVHGPIRLGKQRHCIHFPVNADQSDAQGQVKLLITQVKCVVIYDKPHALGGNLRPVDIDSIQQHHKLVAAYPEQDILRS